MSSSKDANGVEGNGPVGEEDLAKVCTGFFPRV
jgi:hypothetical protein